MKSGTTPARAVIQVTRDPLCDGAISPYQCGQFIEYLCDLVPSMWAEKLYDRHFGGLTPYGVEYIRATDFKQHPWYPAYETNRADYSLDGEERCSPTPSMRIRVTGDSPCTVGIAQSGVAVSARAPLVFRIWMRATGCVTSAFVRLHDHATVVARAELKPTGTWAPLTAVLTPLVTANNCTLDIGFSWKGRGESPAVWLDNASLMPETTIGGWRVDVVRALSALRPGIIRFGGSALEGGDRGSFEWKDTVGDPDQRIPFTAWGGLQPPGAGLEEIVQLCKAVHAEPLLCVRVTGRTPRDAAEEVQYFNGDAHTPMGALRARNGHSIPYGVRYWQVGNELSGSQYEAELPEFCRAMKAADPSIKLLSSYPTPEVLTRAGAFLDYVCPHQYDCANLAAAAAELRATREMIRRYAPGRNIKIAVTEWNTTGGDFGPRRAMLWTLSNALACSRYHNMLHRYADIVEIASRSNLANSFCSGIIQTNGYELYETPTYYAERLYATKSGAQPLKLGASILGSGLDVSATGSPSQNSVTLFCVNDALRSIPATVDMSAYGRIDRRVQVWTVADRDNAGEPDVANSFGDPDRVAMRRSSIEAPGSSFDFTFPRLSLVVLKFHFGHG